MVDHGKARAPGEIPIEVEGSETEVTSPEDDDDIQVWVVDDDGERELGDVGEAVGEAGANGAPPTGVGISEVETLKKELAQVRDQWLRTMADLDNFRKRAEREQRDARRYALFEPMRDLLTVVDNLGRALAAGGSVEDLKQGVEMTLRQFRDTLRSHGVVEVEAVGAPFDPNLHDAVSRHEDPEVAVPTVAAELQRGYRLHERLLRPALVTVAMPGGGKKVEEEPAAEGVSAGDVAAEGGAC